jgi:hypothetical protein
MHKKNKITTEEKRFSDWYLMLDLKQCRRVGLGHVDNYITEGCRKVS